jgi:DNA recombination protein RmuC
MELIIALAIGLAIGVVIGALLMRGRRQPLEMDAMQLSEIRERAAAAEATADARAEQIEGLLAEQRAQQQRAEADNKVLQQLAPVQETLRQMSNKVAELEKERASQFGALNEQLSTSRRNGEQLLSATQGLASALSNNATRGVWGEIQLRRLVESAGLMQHVDFVEQETVRSDSGTGRIDMVVKLSDGKSLAIDSKVPLDKYLEASKIPVTADGADGERRERLLGEHARALRAHVDALAKREYWVKLETSPDLVIGFIPSEALLASALEADPTLLDYAFRKNVALASPVTLWAVLKTVGYSWRQEALSNDAKRLFDLATELYSRVRVMAEHADSLRRSIESTVSNYNKFSSSLESRVLVTARRINENGDPTMELPEARVIDERPRALSAPELIERDFNAVDELIGVARPELDLGLATPPVAKVAKPKSA